eukprot:6183064-Pleurochrysis_carterae.AAC.3
MANVCACAWAGAVAHSVLCGHVIAMRCGASGVQTVHPAERLMTSQKWCIAYCCGSSNHCIRKIAVENLISPFCRQSIVPAESGAVISKQQHLMTGSKFRHDSGTASSMSQTTKYDYPARLKC